jgi:drug/metabolite transporter (DMT)-like permease
MSLAAVGPLLLAALLHASWNAMIRGNSERAWLVTAMAVVTGLAALPFALLLPWPAVASWPYIAVSSVLQMLYVVGLIGVYRVADLSEVYPVIRGSVPLLVALGAAVFAGEHISPVATAGVLFTSLGIMALAIGGRGGPKVLLLAVGTGAVIASYTVTDGVGARLAGNPLAYTAWIFVVYGALMPVAYLLLRGKLVLRADRATGVAVLAGLVQLATYAVMVWALALNPMGPVSALRELSVVFASLIGWRFLGEKVTRVRFGASVVIVAGTVCLSYFS